MNNSPEHITLIDNRADISIDQQDPLAGKTNEELIIDQKNFVSCIISSNRSTYSQESFDRIIKHIYNYQSIWTVKSNTTWDREIIYPRAHLITIENNTWLITISKKLTDIVSKNETTMRRQIISIINEYKNNTNLNSEQMGELHKLEKMCYTIGEPNWSIQDLVTKIDHMTRQNLIDQQSTIDNRESDKQKVIEYCFDPIVQPLSTRSLTWTQYEYQQALNSMTIVHEPMSPFIEYLYKPSWNDKDLINTIQDKLEKDHQLNKYIDDLTIIERAIIKTSDQIDGTEAKLKDANKNYEDAIQDLSKAKTNSQENAINKKIARLGDVQSNITHSLENLKTQKAVQIIAKSKDEIIITKIKEIISTTIKTIKTVKENTIIINSTAPIAPSIIVRYSSQILYNNTHNNKRSGLDIFCNNPQEIIARTTEIRYLLEIFGIKMIDEKASFDDIILLITTIQSLDQGDNQQWYLKTISHYLQSFEPMVKNIVADTDINSIKLSKQWLSNCNYLCNLVL